MTWKKIQDFPDYSVHFTGMVRNDKFDRILALQRNQHGVVNVGLFKDGFQHKRSVALLVAQAFLQDGMPETFDTPIHLDGNLDNNHLENLMWRPRWFAIRFQRQFSRTPCVEKPIQDKHTGERFRNSMAACMKFGLLDRDLFASMLNRTYVWPTYQEFRIV